MPQSSREIVMLRARCCHRFSSLFCGRGNAAAGAKASNSIKMLPSLFMRSPPCVTNLAHLRQMRNFLLRLSDYIARQASRRLAVLPYGLAVHKHARDSFRGEQRLFEGGPVNHALSIKDDQVCF